MTDIVQVAVNVSACENNTICLLVCFNGLTTYIINLTPYTRASELFRFILLQVSTSKCYQLQIVTIEVTTLGKGARQIQKLLHNVVESDEVKNLSGEI